jgi:hypothetical protein
VSDGVVSYQWQSNQAPWADIEGEAGRTFVVAVDGRDYLVNQYIRCIVTATNNVGSSSAESDPVGPFPIP